MWTTGGATYTSTPFGLYPEGAHGFRVWALDEVGRQAWSAEQTVVADRTPPTVTLTLREHSDYAHVDGVALFYGLGAGSFTVTAVLEDRLAGLAQAAFPDTTSPGITYTLAGVTSATRSHTYTFTAASTLTAVPAVAATDRATNVTPETFRLTRDVEPPQVWLDAPRRVYATSIPVTWGATDDASGVACYDLEVQIEDGEWQRLLTRTQSTSYEFTLPTGSYFTFRVTATDNVGNQASVETSSHVARVTKYYYLSGRRVAMRAGDVVYYLHGDHLGSTSLTTDGSGAVVARQLYHPYGTVRHSEGTLPTDFGFGGQRHDGSTGLVFMHARYYHAGLGRFASADTIVPQPGNPQDFNRYAYVRNNPVLYRDPSGHAADSYGNRWSVVDDPLAEPPSPEKVRETAVFLAVGVPAAVFGGPVLGDLAAVGWAGAKALAWKALAWAATHPVEAIVGKAVAEETIESVGTGTPFDPRNVLLDVATQIGDDVLPRRTWQTGDPVDAPTNRGYPSWSTVRRRYWMNTAMNAEQGEFSELNLAGMRTGKAPLDPDFGVPMELHHADGRGMPYPHNVNNLVPLWPWEHADVDPHRYYNGPRP